MMTIHRGQPWAARTRALPRRRRLACAMLVILAAAGCGGPDASSDAAPASSPAATPASPAAAGITITPDGIGPARAGMSVAEIRAALGPGLRLGDPDDAFMVDLTAIPVIRDADTLLYLVFPNDEVLGDGAISLDNAVPLDDAVPLLAVTDHPSARTAEGIGPGSTLADAAAGYGSPRLRFSADDEMREYATFPRYDHPAVLFRVAPGETGMLAGRYAGGEDAGWGETGEYDGGARVMMVMVEIRR